MGNKKDQTCICGEPDGSDEYMIECHACDKFYHKGCVMSEDRWKLDYGIFFCVECKTFYEKYVERGTFPTDQGRKNIFEVYFAYRRQFNPPPPPKQETLEVKMDGCPAWMETFLKTQHLMLQQAMQKTSDQMSEFTRLMQSKSDDSQADHSGVEEMSKMMRRQTIQELPKFTGNPQDWPRFKRAFDETTTEGEFDPRENLSRLERAIPKGSVAFNAIEPLLLDAANVEAIVDQLEFRFGRPERIYESLLAEVMEAKMPKDGNPNSLISFGLKVDSMVINLKAMKYEYYLNDPRLVKDLSMRLPRVLQYKWNEYVLEKQLDNPSLEDFDKWLKIHLRVANLMSTASSSTNRSRPVNIHYESGTNDGQGSSGYVRRDPFCGNCLTKGHRTADCEAFKKFTVPERWKVVKDKRLCIGCLQKGNHRIKDCRSSKACGIEGCTNKHHKLLHSSSDRNSDSHESALYSIPSHRSKTLFRILPIKLYNENIQIETFAFLDDGSSVTLIDNDIAKQLQLTGSPDVLRLKWTKGVERQETNSIRTSVAIRGRNSSKIFTLNNVRTISNLTLPSQTINAFEIKKRFPHLADIPIEDYENAIPKILIGIDNLKVIMNRDIREGRDDEPVGAKTKLGWLVYGKQQHDLSSAASYSMMISEMEDESLHNLVKSYFSTESLGTAPNAKCLRSKEDERAAKIIQNTMRNIGGRYEVGLLWKNDCIKLPTQASYQMSLKRLEHTVSKLEKDPSIKEFYQNKFKDYLDKGYLRELSEGEVKVTGPRTWYLPHFLVVNPNKIPLKPRLVFDAAASAGGMSLNSQLLKGYENPKKLIHIQFRFREGKIAVSGDMKEMFSQVKMMLADQDSLRILMKFGKEDKLKTYVSQVMIFGSKSSPGCAQAVKDDCAKKYANQYPEAAEAIIENTYVDDSLTSFNSIEDAVTVIKQVIEILKGGGFQICNFLSNSREVLSEIPNESKDNVELALSDGSSTVEKVLGVYWDLLEDIYKYKVNQTKIDPQIVNGGRPPTKRELLRITMSLYDPLGLLSHFLIRAKILLQEIWRKGFGWDSPVDRETQEKWKIWLQELSRVERVKIPRWYSTEISKTTVEMHTFCDAAETAFATAIYFRIVSEKEVKVVLVTAKARVAPVKPLSIPKLELQAALLGSRLSCEVADAHRLKIAKKYYWSDSQVVLEWIKGEHRRFVQFVGHRVGEILELTNAYEWNYVPTKLNSADDATRINDLNFEDVSSRWYQGPQFLSMPESEWPQGSSVEDVNLCQEYIMSIENQGELKLKFEAIQEKPFSCYRKMVRCYAYVGRYIQLKLKIQESCPKFLTVEELENAELVIIRKVQYEAFRNELEDLHYGRPLDKSSSIIQLNPVVENGVIRMKGRLDNAPIRYATRFPLILPYRHKIVDLIVHHYHCKYLHQFHESVICAIRQRFWIVNIRKVVKRVVSKCQFCKNRKAQPIAPKMAALPWYRVTPTPKPFTFVGIDLFGPIQVTITRHREKRYGVLFTCMVTRAVHVEVAHSLNTDSCIMAMRNFLCRRGPVRHLYSDNGTNFVGADNELKRALAELRDQLGGKMAEFNIDWHFNPPAAPHFGGAWERLVKSIKGAFYVLLKEVAPKEEVLRNLLIECEYIVNSRPLTHISMDSTDDEPLTPNHFLINCAGGASNPMLPGLFTERDTNARQIWRRSQHLANLFWSRWTKEYLPVLTRRSKWLHDVKPIAEGDIVVVCDPNAPRNNWQKGRVTQVMKSPDGQVRVAKVKTVTGEYTRPVVKLAKLDLSDESPKVSSPGGGCAGRTEN